MKVPKKTAPGGALEIFENALDLITKHEHSLGAIGAQASLPLPSMLERCEEILLQQREQTALLRIAYVVPGAVQSDPDWWEARVPGLTAITASSLHPSLITGLPRDGADKIATQHLMTLVQEMKVYGRQLLIIVTPGQTIPDIDLPRVEALIVLHPMSALEATLGMGARVPDVELVFYKELSNFTDNHKDLTTFYSEELAPASGLEKALQNALSIHVSDPIIPPASGQCDENGTTLEDIRNAPTSQAYIDLCGNLGYETERFVPVETFCGSGQFSLPWAENLRQKLVENAARISEFSDRAIQLARQLSQSNPELIDQIREVENIRSKMALPDLVSMHSPARDQDRRNGLRKGSDEFSTVAQEDLAAYRLLCEQLDYDLDPTAVGRNIYFGDTHQPGKRSSSTSEQSTIRERIAEGNRPIIILIAGMRHSGSTAAFNLVRYLFDMNNIEYCSWYSEHKTFPTTDTQPIQVAIVKIHEPRDDILQAADFIITTRRNLLDTVASAIRREFTFLKDIGGPVKYAGYNRGLSDLWKNKSDHEILYENFISNDLDVIENLCIALGFPDQDIKKLSEKVSNIPTNKYEETLLSPNHITDPDRKLSYHDTLPSSAISEIQRQHGLWLIQNGYLCVN